MGSHLRVWVSVSLHWSWSCCFSLHFLPPWPNLLLGSAPLNLGQMWTMPATRWTRLVKYRALKQTWLETSRGCRALKSARTRAGLSLDVRGSLGSSFHHSVCATSTPSAHTRQTWRRPSRQSSPSALIVHLLLKFVFTNFSCAFSDGTLYSYNWKCVFFMTSMVYQWFWEKLRLVYKKRPKNKKSMICSTNT